MYDLIDQDAPNPYNGYSDRSRIQLFDSSGQVLKEPNPSHNREYLASYFPTDRNIDCSVGPYPKATNFLDYNTPCADNVGDRNDLFGVGSVISPFSNPPARSWNTDSSRWDTAWVAIRVVSFDSASKVYRLEVARVGRPLYENMPPARPQRVRFDTSAVSQFPALQWDPNGEPGMTFRDFVSITFCPDAVLYHTDSLILRQVETNRYSHVVGEPGGVFIIDTTARIDKLFNLEIRANASLVVRDSSITRMSPQGQISLYDNSTFDASPETWALRIMGAGGGFGPLLARDRDLERERSNGESLLP